MERQARSARQSIEVLLFTCLISLAVASAQEPVADPRKPVWAAIHQGGLVWVDPGHDVAQTDGYEFSEKFNARTYERTVYVKAPGQMEPKAFYKHERQITVALGHSRQIVLINDHAATKFTRVVVATMSDGSAVDVGSQAMEQYQREVKPDWRLEVNPEGYALSPDDRQVLVRIALIYLSVQTPKEAADLAKTFQPRWYVVDTRDGHILKTFSGENPPASWY